MDRPGGTCSQGEEKEAAIKKKACELGKWTRVACGRGRGVAEAAARCEEVGGEILVDF